MKNNKKILLLAVAVLLVFVVVIFPLIPKIRNISPADIVSILPDNLIAVTVILLGLYALKSISIVFPIVALYITTGMLYPLSQAMLVSLAGTIVTLSIGYFVGAMCGEKWFDKLKVKYSQVEKLESYRSSNQIVFAYITRVVGVLPCDVLSWYMGNRRMRYTTYLAGSLLGMLPILVLNTIFGERLSEGITAEIIFLGIALVVSSFLLSYLGNKAMKRIYRA